MVRRIVLGVDIFLRRITYEKTYYLSCFRCYSRYFRLRSRGLRNGVKVELNGDADAAIAALGEYKDVSSQLSCHGEGEDKTYTYDNFVLNTYPLDGKDRVLEIVVKSADIPTSKGVKVGDSASAVKEAYGDGFREVGTYYAYDAGDGKSLQFLIENDSVKEIDYYYDV